MVIVPLRDAPPFWVAVTTAVPLPVVAPATVRNDALLVVVHWQLSGAVTVMLVLPPPLFALVFVVDSRTTQLVGAMRTGGPCVKTTVAPLTVMLAERDAPVLAAKL